MQSLPELQPLAREVLEVVLTNPSIDGSTLLKYSNGEPAELVGAIRELQKHRFIEVGGPVTVDGLPFARFAVLPSAKDYLQAMLKP